MGIFDIIFGSSKPRVTDQEYKKVKSQLYMEGFTQRERNKVDEIFKPDYYETATASHPRCLEPKEIAARIKWMRENPSKHGFSPNRIDEIEQEMKKRL